MTPGARAERIGGPEPGGAAANNQSFYEGWLALPERAEAEKRAARIAINPGELQWVQTRQDARAALLIGQENGFRTCGTSLMVAEIPVGWQTGRHSHGEEGIFVVRGRGCSIVGDRRYDWEAGAAIWIPFGLPHQHVNLGDEPVVYVSALTPDLEYWCLVPAFEQHTDCGPVDTLPPGLADQGDIDDAGRQIVFHLRDAPVTAPRGMPADAVMSAWRASMPAVMSTEATGLPPERRSIHLMYPPKYVGQGVEITHIFCYGAGDSSPKHAHMEAMLYVIEGRGYSIIDEERFEWEAGSAFHVQGPQTVHQFFATEPSKLLRIHFGIRSHFFQPIAKERFPYQFLGTEAERAAIG